jgi:hypothetical protein
MIFLQALRLLQHFKPIILNGQNVSLLFTENIYKIIYLMPIIFSFFYVNYFGVNLIEGDEFNFVDFVLDKENVYTNFLLLVDEHLLYLSMLFFVLVARFTNYNCLAIMNFSIVLLNIIYIFLVVKFNKSNNKLSNLFFSFIYMLLLFNPRAYDALLAAMGIIFACSNFFSLFSFYFFQNSCSANVLNKKIQYFILAILFASSATLSSAQGIFSWVTVFILWIAIERKKIVKDFLFYIWCVFSIFFFIIYLIVSDSEKNNALLSNLLNHPFAFLRYFFIFVGNAATGTIFGIIIICIATLLLFDFIHNNKKKKIFPICLIVNFIIVAIVTSLARLDLSPSQGASSRYVVFSLAIILGFVLYLKELTYLSFLKYKIYLNNFKFKFLYIIILSSVFIFFCIGIINSIIVSNDKKLSQFYFKTFETQPLGLLSRLSTFFPRQVLAKGSLLQKNRMNIFSVYGNNISDNETLPLFTLENNQKFVILDKINFNLTFNDPFITFSGFATDPENNRNVDSVYIILNNYKFICYYKKYNLIEAKISSLIRNDVNGFVRSVPLRLLPDGIYKIRLQAINSSKTKLFETEILCTLIVNNNYLIINNKYFIK